MLFPCSAGRWSATRFGEPWDSSASEYCFVSRRFACLSDLPVSPIFCGLHEISLKEAASSVATTKAFRSGVFLSITNPQSVAYWAALGSALGALGISEPTPEDYVVFLPWVHDGVVVLVLCLRGIRPSPL
jgi:hypothetical protein